jgi:hypothetical protein
MKLTKQISLTLFSVFSLFMLISCEDKKDDLPESAMLSGTITFTGDWPSAGDVYLSVQSAWPPTAAPYSAVIVTAGDVTDGLYDYSFTDVAFGTYPAITVSWLDPDDNDPTTNQHTIGAYGGTIQTGFMDASGVTVDAENATKTDLDITADFSTI